MELMRHSDLRLTMKIYTDATCLPAAEGIDRLPSLTKVCPQLRPQKLGASRPSGSQLVTADVAAEPSEDPARQ